MSCPVAGCVCYVQLDRSMVYCAGWQMRRREFIKAITASAADSPLTAGAHHGERMRRVAVLMSVDNPEARANHAAFVQSLKQLGWVDGQNIRIETRRAQERARQSHFCELERLYPTALPSNYCRSQRR